MDTQARIAKRIKDGVREATAPAIPDVTEDNLLDVVKKLKAAVDSREGRLGNPVDGFVTFRDLVRLGLARNKLGEPNYGSPYVVGDKNLPVAALPYFAKNLYEGSQDQTAPPAPTNLQITAYADINVLRWDQKDYFNHHYFEVWRATTNDFEQAELVGSPVGKVFADIPGPGGHYYWVRTVAQSYVRSVLNAKSGTYIA